MPGPEPAAAVPGPCIFGTGRLLPLIDVLSAEIAGVREDDDIEHVHRMRVASRRLRAALPLFAECFPEKEYRLWLREIKKITRALGAARDTDVQIAFLKKYLKSQAAPIPQNVPVKNPEDTSHSGDPLGTLLARLQKQRGILQKKVIAVLDELEHSQVLPSLRAACAPPTEIGKRKKRERYAGVLPVAAGRVGRRLQAIHQYEPFVHNPDAVFEHHALRIAAKKLRYTLEAYAPLYRRSLARPIARIKRLQDLLGDIHDCDVWIEQMSLAIVRQRSRRHPDAGEGGPSVSAVLRSGGCWSTARNAGPGCTGSLSGTGMVLYGPVSGRSCHQQRSPGSVQPSPAAALFRQKRSVRRFSGSLPWHRITWPTAVQLWRLRSGFSTNWHLFTAFPAATAPSSLMPRPCTTSAGSTGRPATRKRARR